MFGVSSDMSLDTGNTTRSRTRREMDHSAEDSRTCIRPSDMPYPYAKHPPVSAAVGWCHTVFFAGVRRRHSFALAGAGRRKTWLWQALARDVLTHERGMGMGMGMSPCTEHQASTTTCLTSCTPPPPCPVSGCA